jgi:hypothetical protein
VVVSTAEQMKTELRKLVDSVTTRLAGERWKEHNEYEQSISSAAPIAMQWGMLMRPSRRYCRS